ncbi:MAG: hypothetical protein WCP73_05115 [Eubacteriales bacterium]
MEKESLKSEVLTYDVCELIAGSSVDVHANRNESEVRADIVVEKKRSVRLWGQVLTAEQNPVQNALVQLVRVSNRCDCGKVELEGIAHTVTDSQGFYQFDVSNVKDDTFKIIVGKPVVCCRVIPLLEEFLDLSLYHE